MPIVSSELDASWNAMSTTPSANVRLLPIADVKQFGRLVRLGSTTDVSRYRFRLSFSANKRHSGHLEASIMPPMDFRLFAVYVSPP